MQNTDKKRQEEIILSKIKMQHTWKEHSNFEIANKKSNVKNNEALEVHFALPNDLYQKKEKLEQVCDDMVKEIVGENKDYQYAIHWNHDRTNLHCHILFSERENQQDLVPKIYKKTNGEIEILINWQRQIVKTLIFMQERETSKRIKR